MAKKRRKTKSKTKPKSRAKSQSKMNQPSPLIDAISAIRQRWRAIEAGRRRQIINVGFWVFIALSSIVAGTLYLRSAESRIYAGLNGEITCQFDISFKATSPSIDASVIRGICRDIKPKDMLFNDPLLTDEIRKRASKNPLIKEVIKVSLVRVPSTLRGRVIVEATFRTPYAAVQKKDSRGVIMTYYVDREGVLLPSHQVSKYASAPTKNYPRGIYYISNTSPARRLPVKEVHYMTIAGVKSPPPNVGEIWRGDDLVDAIKIVTFFMSRKYYFQVSFVDVDDRSNIIIKDRLAGEKIRILFGRFPRINGDYIVSPRRKFTNLDKKAAENGGSLLGYSHRIDLRV